MTCFSGLILILLCLYQIVSRNFKLIYLTNIALNYCVHVMYINSYSYEMCDIVNQKHTKIKYYTIISRLPTHSKIISSILKETFYLQSTVTLIYFTYIQKYYDHYCYIIKKHCLHYIFLSSCFKIGCTNKYIYKKYTKNNYTLCKIHTTTHIKYHKKIIQNMFETAPKKPNIISTNKYYLLLSNFSYYIILCYLKYAYKPNTWQVQTGNSLLLIECNFLIQNETTKCVKVLTNAHSIWFYLILKWTV